MRCAVWIDAWIGVRRGSAHGDVPADMAVAAITEASCWQHTCPGSRAWPPCHLAEPGPAPARQRGRPATLRSPGRAPWLRRSGSRAWPPCHLAEPGHAPARKRGRLATLRSPGRTRYGPPCSRRGKRHRGPCCRRAWKVPPCSKRGKRHPGAPRDWELAGDPCLFGHPYGGSHGLSPTSAVHATRQPWDSTCRRSTTRVAKAARRWARRCGSRTRVALAARPDLRRLVRERLVLHSPAPVAHAARRRSVQWRRLRRRRLALVRVAHVTLHGPRA